MEEWIGMSLTVRFWNSQARNFVMASLEKTLGTFLCFCPLIEPFCPSLRTDSLPSSLEPQRERSSSPKTHQYNRRQWPPVDPAEQNHFKKAMSNNEEE